LWRHAERRASLDDLREYDGDATKFCASINPYGHMVFGYEGRSP
jgi:hypothetical protein